MGVAQTSPGGKVVCVWILINLMLLVFVISSWIAASSKLLSEFCQEELDATQEFHQGSRVFILLWQVLIALVLSILGTCVLRHHRDELHIGVFVGASCILANWMLTTAIETGSLVMEKRSLNELKYKSSGVSLETKATSAVILFLLYGVLAILLVQKRTELLGNGTENNSEAEDDDIFTDYPKTSREHEIQLT